MEEKNLELVTQLRRELHQHPELAHNEKWTKQRLINFLKEHTGLEIVDRDACFYAVYRAGEGKRNVGFRADFDAVPMEDAIDKPYKSQNPGAGHKCGHDGHSAILCGLAMEVEQMRPDCNVYFFFQHAEEVGGGGEYSAAIIPELSIDEIFAYHNMGGFEGHVVYLRDGVLNCASKGMTLILTGEQTHASTPELGKNPVFALARIIDRLPAVYEPSRYKGVILCTIVQVDLGQRAFGMSASKGVMRMTVRGEYEEELEQMIKEIEDVTAEECAKDGILWESAFVDTNFPENRNHKESADKIRAAAARLGLKINELPEPMRGSEDFGFHTKLTKGAMFFYGNGIDTPSVHSSGYDFPDEQIPEVVEIFKALLDS